MQSESNSVIEYIQNLNHPQEDLIFAIRKLILNVEKALVENIKWNAPNYVFQHEDRFTFNFPPKKTSVRLILHFGARKKVNARMQFDKPVPKCFSWLANDRGMLSFATLDEFETYYPESKDVLTYWLTLS